MKIANLRDVAAIFALALCFSMSAFGQIDWPPWISDKEPPFGRITINDGDEYTDSPIVTLKLEAYDTESGVRSVYISGDVVLSLIIPWFVLDYFEYPDQITKIGNTMEQEWELSGEDGTKTVYAVFKDGAGNESYPVSDTIILHTGSPVTLYVKPDGNDKNDGRSLVNAKLTIQAAIDAAGTGAEIKVAAGTYNESLTLEENVKLMGAGAETTKIEYSGDRSVTIYANQIENAEISGFTIAYAGKMDSHSTILLVDSSPTIANNIITGAIISGVGIKGNSDPKITGNAIINNAGAGIFIYSAGKGIISENIISRNAYSGIQIKEEADPKITGNEITNNAGAGIYIYSRGKGTISENTISGNVYSGIEVKEGSDPKISNNTIEDNEKFGIYIHSEAYGTISGNTISENTYSGILIAGNSEPKISNNTIEGNKEDGILIHTGSHGIISGNVVSGNRYSGIEVKEKSDPQIVYNTIVVNKGNGIWVYIGAAPVISNNIIVKNSDDGIDIRGHDYGSDGNPQVSYNDVWGNDVGNYEGMKQPDTDISVDPLFVDLENGDYHLQSNSPCRGKSDNGSDLGAYQVSGYTITASAGANGSISPSGEVVVSSGSDQTFTITPAEGYQVADVKVDGASIGALASYIFADIRSNHTLEVSFKQVAYAYTIIASAGANGSISPSGEVVVSSGSDQTFTITPAEGYQVADVKVDGASIGALVSYTFVNVQSDHTLEASFKQAAYTITASAGANGSISPSGAVKVSSGTDQTFTITPAEGYQVADVRVDGASIGVLASYTFTNIRSNHTLEASFTAQAPYIKGDVNSDGAVRSNDALLTLRIAAGLIEPTDYQKQAADMSGDDRVMSNDAILILRKAAGLAAPGRNSVAGGDQITMSLDEVRGISGETIEVSLRANRASELGGGDLHIAYNSEVLRLDGVSHESGILLAHHVAGPGILRVAFASIDELSSKIVARLKFHILTDDVSSLKFQKAELYNTSAVSINFRLLDGEFRSWAIPADHNALLQNFPNPSNPDTWIPYQLKEGANVTIKIYTVTGKIVRILDLGYKSAGFYTGKGRAAYWDGMNEGGENVSSGIYFYTMQAGSSTATRKMTVLK
jgi:parallel beta-helix repeat protein